MGDRESMLAQLQAEGPRVAERLMAWSRVNSGSHNLPGLEAMAQVLQRAFDPWAGPLERLELPPFEQIGPGGELERVPLGRALRWCRRPAAPHRVLLAIHYDTVFGPAHPFQEPHLAEDSRLVGPGVCDAKGGILVPWLALQAFESHPAAAKLGWELILNPDEELGSPGSTPLLREAAHRSQVGLLFEPALSDGSLVGARKGSGNFTVVVRGRAAHAGRDFAAGRSAVLALAELLLEVDSRARALGGGVTFNCGQVSGGHAANVVPDLAIARCNARADTAEEAQAIESALREVGARFGAREGIRLSIVGGFASPPKPLDPASTRLQALALDCGQSLGIKWQVKSSGGACDGNRLAAWGLPVLDSLGPIGGELHSEREYVVLPSILERASLLALMLVRLAEDGFGP